MCVCVRAFVPACCVYTCVCVDVLCSYIEFYHRSYSSVREEGPYKLNFGGRTSRGGVPEEAYRTIDTNKALVCFEDLTNAMCMYKKVQKEVKTHLTIKNRPSIVVQRTCDEERYDEMRRDMLDAELVDEIEDMDHSKLGIPGEFVAIDMQEAHLDDVEANPDKYANDKRKVSYVLVLILFEPLLTYYTLVKVLLLFSRFYR